MSEKKPKPKKITEAQYHEMENLAKRLQADFDNYRKRSQKEKEEFAAYLNSDLILRIIPVMDNFQLALKHLPAELEGNNWVQGIFHIEKQLEQILADEGVTRISTEGNQFNPHLHEALEEVPSEEPEGTITEEVSAGYKLNEKVIRHAKVKVSTGNIKEQLSTKENLSDETIRPAQDGDEPQETENE